jgi:hypothetical protein
VSRARQDVVARAQDDSRRAEGALQERGFSVGRSTAGASSVAWRRQAVSMPRPPSRNQQVTCSKTPAWGGNSSPDAILADPSTFAPLRMVCR